MCAQQTPAINCCTETNPCGDNEGICETNADCEGSLRCGINNCPEGFPPNSNCCTSSPCDAGTYLSTQNNMWDFDFHLMMSFRKWLWKVLFWEF